MPAKYENVALPAPALFELARDPGETTDVAAANLIRVGVDPARVHVTGNTGIDSVRLTGDRVRVALGARGRRFSKAPR